MIKTVAVIGGTGMLGRPVSEAFARAGYRVNVITRNAEKAASGFNNTQNIKFVQADLFSHAQLEDALRDADAIHINLSGNSDETYLKNHIEGTEAILNAKSDRTKLITMISTATAYHQNNFRVDTRAKLAAEQKLEQSGVNYITYLPSWFYETLWLLTEAGTVTTLGDSTQPLRWLSANDYANAVVKSYQSPELYNRRLTLLGPHAYTIHAAADRFAEFMGFERGHMNNEEASAYAAEVNEDMLNDALDLLRYTEKEIGRASCRERVYAPV